jgi:hypothetical protein
MHDAAHADLIQCRIDERDAGHVAYVTVNNPEKKTQYARHTGQTCDCGYVLRGLRKTTNCVSP